MHVSWLNSLLFLSLNGPGVGSFPAQRFSKMWIKEESEAADDPPPGERDKEDHKSVTRTDGQKVISSI